MLSPDNADEDPFDCFGDDSGSSTTSEEDSSSAELLVTKQHRHDEIKNIKAARKLVKQFNDDPVSIQQMIRPEILS